MLCHQATLVSAATNDLATVVNNETLVVKTAHSWKETTYFDKLHCLPSKEVSIAELRDVDKSSNHTPALHNISSKRRRPSYRLASRSHSWRLKRRNALTATISATVLATSMKRRIWFRMRLVVLCMRRRHARPTQQWYPADLRKEEPRSRERKKTPQGAKRTDKKDYTD